MKASSSAVGRIVVGGLALVGGAWVGAVAASRTESNPQNVNTAAVLGALTGALGVTFAGAGAAIASKRWRPLGATTAVLGAGLLTSVGLLGLKNTDRIAGAPAPSSLPNTETAST